MGRRRKYSLRVIWDAVAYVLVGGCQWRLLPKCFPPWRTVYGYFASWRDSGVIDRLSQRFCKRDRVRSGRNSRPSAAVIDSQTVKTSCCAREAVGYDAGKKTKGRKRHLLVDTDGRLIDVVVHAADIQDRDGAKLVLERFARSHHRLRHLWADGGYQGRLVEWVARLRQRNPLRLEIVKRPDVPRFVVLPRRWVVERTNAWISASRRLSMDYERLTDSSKAFIQMAMARLLLRKLAK